MMKADTRAIRAGASQVHEVSSGLNAVMRSAEAAVDAVTSLVGHDDLDRELRRLRNANRSTQRRAVASLHAYADQLELAASVLEATDRELATSIEVEA